MFYSNCVQRLLVVASFVAFVLVFSVLVGVCEGYSGVIPPDPANPGKCVYHDQELVPGANRGPGPCLQLTCLEDGTILINGCGKLRIQSCNHGERITPSKPYPECCKLKYKCRREDGTPYYIERDVSDDKTENSA